MKNNKIIYSLIVEDIQSVALEEIGRKLTSNEVEKVLDPIAEKINWQEAIADAINEVIIFKWEKR